MRSEWETVSGLAEEIRLVIYPRVSLRGGVRIEAVIPRHPDNRRMRIEVDGPTFRAFEEQMEGEAARVIYAITLDESNLPSGWYGVVGVVIRAGGQMKVARDSFCRGSGCIREVQ